MSPERFEMGHSGLWGACVLAASLWAVACGGPEYPNCETDEDCKAEEFCVNNLCQQCRGDQDCPAGQTCASGACQDIPGYCTSADDCAPGETCENNMCVTTQTTEAPKAPEPAASQCTLKSVYFAFDSSTLESNARDQLSSNAECIKERDMPAVHLTGLTDPRGTEEYNLALGDRRARSAKKYLKSLGVQAELTHSSLGEEMASGTDEASWARDRRVDFQAK